MSKLTGRSSKVGLLTPMIYLKHNLAMYDCRLENLNVWYPLVRETVIGQEHSLSASYGTSILFLGSNVDHSSVLVATASTMFVDVELPI
jgi:hypothetical protein